MSASGVETDPDKIKALKTWPSPTNLNELRSIHGFFCGVLQEIYQIFFQNSKPLNHLTSGYPPLRKLRKTQEMKGQYLNPSI